MATVLAAVDPLPVRTPAAAASYEITLHRHADFMGWRRAARRLLVAGIPPEAVSFRVDEWQPSLFEAGASSEAVGSPCHVPRLFVRLAEQAALHSDRARFALLYRILWRVTHGERAILHHRSGDREVMRAEAMAAAVRRAALKLRTLIRFREIEGPDGSRLVAWFEPEHHVLERVARSFRERFPGRCWSVVTPMGSAHGEDDGRIWFGPGGQRRDVPPPGADDTAWRQWYESLGSASSPPKVVPLRRHGASGPSLLVEGPVAGERGARAEQVLMRALQDAGLDPARIARTRAGGGAGLTAARRLELERARLRPGLIIALGVTAAEALLERPVSLSLERGRMLPLNDGSRLLVTADPATIRAIPDPTAQGREYRRLVADLLLAVPYQARAA